MFCTCVRIWEGVVHLEGWRHCWTAVRYRVNVIVSHCHCHLVWPRPLSGCFTECGVWLLWLCRQCLRCCGAAPHSHLSNGVIGGWSIDPETTFCVKVNTFSFNYANGLCYIVNTTEVQPSSWVCEGNGEVFLRCVCGGSQLVKYAAV